MDNYDPSDSEDEYTEKEKQLLNKVRNRKEAFSDSEDEVFSVGVDEDDEDDDDEEANSNLALSDVEDQDDGDLPDIRAWGKDKRKYYSTDYVDPDYGGFQGKDAQLAELEEEEARNLQKHIAQQLDDDDFSLDIFTKKTEEDKKQSEEIIKTDISQLSKRQKLQILKKESPEFFGLVEDFEAKMLIAKNYLRPILQMHKKYQIPRCQAMNFVQTFYELILNYSTNIYMYLLLKSSKVNVRNHPVIKRLYQYRQLLTQLDPVYEEIIKPQLEIMLLQKESLDAQDKVVEKTKKLKQMSALIQKSKQSDKKNKKVTIVEEEQPSKRTKVSKSTANIDTGGEIARQTGADLAEDDSDSSADENDKAETEQENQEETSEQKEVNKRAITYAMAKNKGLTPHRKKEQRNPRVKHRLKYRKAIIRRKGAVREPKTELSRYSGEHSGIKASVSKSIKIKT